MTKSLLFAVAVFVILGCGSAQLIQQPTFSYTFNPPFQWTFGPNATGLWPRQYLTFSDANQSMYNDVSGSFQQAMQMAGFSTFMGSLKYVISGYSPTTNITISQQNIINTYVPEVGAVTGFRSSLTQIQPYPQVNLKLIITIYHFWTQQIRVTQSQLYLLKAQWQTVASYLYNALNMQRNVHFLSQITVS